MIYCASAFAIRYVRCAYVYVVLHWHRERVCACTYIPDVAEGVKMNVTPICPLLYAMNALIMHKCL